VGTEQLRTGRRRIFIAERTDYQDRSGHELGGDRGGRFPGLCAPPGWDGLDLGPGPDVVDEECAASANRHEHELGIDQRRRLSRGRHGYRGRKLDCRPERGAHVSGRQSGANHELGTDERVDQLRGGIFRAGLYFGQGARWELDENWSAVGVAMAVSKELRASGGSSAGSNRAVFDAGRPPLDHRAETPRNAPADNLRKNPKRTCPIPQSQW